MKLKWLILGIVGVILLAVIACASIPKQVSVDESSSGKQTEIAVGGSITVTLDSNATTGYSWQLTGISDSSVIEKTNNVYETPTSNLMGAGGEEVWTFKALSTGKATLNMAYGQPWTGGQKDAKSFTLMVIVK